MSIDPRGALRVQHNAARLDAAAAAAPTNGDDRVTGSATSDDRIDGKGGDDTLTGLAGADTLIGGTGDDLLIANDNDGAVDRLNGGDGDDTMHGGLGDVFSGGADLRTPGSDWSLGDWAIVEVKTSLAVNLRAIHREDGSASIGGKVDGIAQPKARLSGIEHLVVISGSGDDRLIAGAFETELHGGTGADTLVGLAGDDTLVAGAGADSLDGGLGDDLISATDGDGVRDRLYGGQGDDIVSAWLGDLLDGGEGRDLVEFDLSGQFSPVVLDLRGILADGSGQAAGSIGGSRQPEARLSGFEDAILSGGWGADLIWAGAIDTEMRGASGDDTLVGGAGNDTLIGGAGNDRLNGGDGFDMVQYTDGPFFVGVDIDLGAHSGHAHGVSNPQIGADILLGIEGAKGTYYTDVITGDGRANWLIGSYGGEDSLYGMGGNDLLDVDVSGGAKTVDGGAGRDTVSFVASGWAAGGVVVDLRITTAQNTNGASLTLTGVENISGGENWEHFIGSDLANTLAGGDGGDWLEGAKGADVLSGDGEFAMSGSGEVVLFGFWDADATDLQGYAEALARVPAGDLTSGRYDDRIMGGDGNDTIYGGLGRDTLDGGTNWDGKGTPPDESPFSNVFVYQSVLESITGYDDLILLRANDFIDLSDIDANAGTEGDDAFVVAPALTGSAGQLTVVYDAGWTYVTGDTDGDGIGEFQIRIEGDAHDFDGFIL